MAGSRPKISFTFPYRWIDDPSERQHLEKRIKDSLKKGGLTALFGSGDNKYYMEQLRPVVAYWVVLKYHAYQPIKINLTQKELAKIFKDVFPGGTLVQYQTFFVQTYTPTGLPVLEMEVFY